MKSSAAWIPLLVLACGADAPQDGSSSSSSGAVDSTTDVPSRCGGAPGNCETYLPCDPCGQPRDVFDAQGCLRAACGQDEDCAMGERCFVATDFDQCASSQISCADDPLNMVCACEQTNDCNGAWCVPEAEYPPTMAGPAGVLVISRNCGPDDGIIVELRSWPVGTEVTCDSMPTDVEPQLELHFADPGLVGVYRFSAMAANGNGTFTAEDEDPVDVRAATLEIADEVSLTTDGSYSFVVYAGTTPRLYAGFFTGVLQCPLAGPCG